MDKEIIVIGSLEPHKAIQDQARVIGGGVYVQPLELEIIRAQ